VILAASDTTNRLAGPAALVVVLLLLVVTVLLVRNMDGRLRRLPKEFPADGHGVPRTPPTGTPDARRPDLVEIPPQD
jgi:hypothetical protein